MIILDDHSYAHDEKLVYLFNIQSKKFQHLNIFNHRKFSENIIESLVQQGIYQSDNTDGYISYYSPQAYEEAHAKASIEKTDAFKITDIKWQDLKDLWSSIKTLDIFPIKEQSHGLAHYDLHISPTDVFDEKFKQEFSNLLKTQHVQCFYELYHDGYYLLKTQKNTIYYVNRFIEKSLFEELWKLPSCRDLQKRPLVNSTYLKYTSIDRVQGRGNHFMFWFDPVGFNVFELKQNGHIKQFKVPINHAFLYQIDNELIIKSKLDEKIYHIHM